MAIFYRKKNPFSIIIALIRSINFCAFQVPPGLEPKPFCLYPIPWEGAVAQLGERSVRNAEVEGSIPFGSTLPLQGTVQTGRGNAGPGISCRLDTNLFSGSTKTTVGICFRASGCGIQA